MLATVVGLVLKLTDSTTSQFWDVWGLPITFVVALGGYTLVLVLARPGWFATARPFDPVEEVADPWEDRVRCHACDRSYLAREMDRDPSAGHDAICAACATGGAFERAARAEARPLA